MAALQTFVLSLQTFVLLPETRGEKPYRSGLQLAISCAALLLGTIYGTFFFAEPSSTKQVILAIVTTTGASLAISGAVSIPRTAINPKVDAQHAVSALSKYSFSWMRPLLDLAREQGTLKVDDLPALGRKERSKHLNNRFTLGKKPLWRRVIVDHRRAIITQWALTGIESFLLIGPQLCLFQLLKLLERKDSGDVEARQLWLWAVSLAIVKVAHLFCESWVEWVSWAFLATPIRSQLSVLIYSKSMRLKDVKAVSRPASTPSEEPQDDDEEPHETKSLLGKEDGVDAAADEENQEGAAPKEESNENVQGAINLLGVDVQRVSDFAGYNVLVPGSLLKVIIASAFLVNLIGWVSTIVGLSIPILFQPLNQIATRGYSNAAEALMMMRDEKAHVVGEALHGIRQIKFSAIEQQWQEIIMATRNKELAAQWRAFKWATFMVFTWLSMPILLGAAALGTYAWLNGSVTAAVAFTALSVFSSLEWTLSVVPTTITELLDAKVSINRIEQHLKQPNERHLLESGDSISFEHASVAWPSRHQDENTFTLKDVSLRFPVNQFSVVHGRTGSGKSLLLAAILGEADILKGIIRAPSPSPAPEGFSSHVSEDNWLIPSKMAFVAQVPWTENASLKDNILFGLPFLETRYRKVLDACALTKDLNMLPDGEDTEIGANGINLSGGQRWRVTLARALYSRAGILVLDDIFSAVDAHVGQHILANALHGDLVEGRTRILVTHHVALVLQLADYVVELDEGCVKKVTEQAPLVQHFDAPEQSWSTIPSSSNTITSDDLTSENPKIFKAPPKKFVEEESREKGRVKLGVYKAYMSASGRTLYWAVIITIYVVSALTMLLRSYWVKHWTQQPQAQSQSNSPSKYPSSSKADESQGHELKYYLGIYVAISCFAALTTAVKSLVVRSASLRASRQLFETIIYTVLRAPLRWLDTVPVGRIMNRLVSDFALVDSRLAGDFNWSFHGFLVILTIICSALFVSWYMIFPILLFATVGMWYTNIYLEGARDIKRLESNAKSPIFELLGSSLAGLSTIRSFGKADEYMERMFSRTDDYARTTWYLLLASRWMAFRQGLFGAIFTFFVAAAVILIHGITASLAGFTLGFALEYSNIAIHTIARYTGFELDMNSVERVVEYTNLPTENQSGDPVPHDWPQAGALEVRNLSVRYAPDLPLVLSDLSFSIQPRQRVGVIGRTGSGKSSLTLSLFRVLEAERGSIVIDGIDISTIRLSDLRSRLAIIPQDPVLFSGTLRENLDPWGKCTDGELFEALKRVHLLDDNDGDASLDTAVYGRSRNLSSNINIFNNLSTPISRSGLNLSQGQRQLLCLARAMVTRPRIMVLDEATSAVDMATDRKIQRSIREGFQESTLIVIAHRLSTVADFDRVLVMEEGKGECDTPANLLGRKGPFREMVMKSGERGAIERMVMGKEQE
ncbi:P-loop containing nucleoside triphosphate hydrolase protein [Delitschia confertaspora ATCC 74209]|uniref:P-loop containing nucleoside triphosphate hydrolase protein n=1 Tax=Delitschia confertaspora ATCC 74209 TaxID=1513339 RepID=A0A9P4JIY6_9PLEO|nr:P-loop containing nucleoside triphosphate hydrolase protein [Delitschia confertaspora ATCC 74209]